MCFFQSKKNTGYVKLTWNQSSDRTDQQNFNIIWHLSNPLHIWPYSIKINFIVYTILWQTHHLSTISINDQIFTKSYGRKISFVLETLLWWEIIYLLDQILVDIQSQYKTFLELSWCKFIKKRLMGLSSNRVNIYELSLLFGGGCCSMC